MSKVVFITGSTRGIGKAISYKFAENGYTVVLHGLHQTASSRKLEQDIKKISPDSKIFYFDVIDEKNVIAQCRRILTNFKKIDVLINNAGILRDRTFLKMTTAEWDIVMKTNLYGTYYVTKQILPSMVAQKYGRIINISSIIGIRGNFGQTNYSASKAAVIGLTKSLAKETARYNIMVNAICPGLVETDILKNVPQEYLNKLKKNISLGRIARPAEIAELAYYLASDNSNYITGNTINIDGGWL